ncbi:MAG: integrase, partial [Methylococcales bacterium]
MKQQAQIEYISHPNKPFTEKASATNNKGNLRGKVFILTFLVSIIVGISINYSRPAVYQSSATLLTSAATDVDQASRDVDFQQVSIQKQKLLGAELLTRTLLKLKSQDNGLDLTDLTLADIRNMLKVEPIKETNLLNMTANGSPPELLAMVVNTWIDVYLEARAANVKNAASNTEERINGELIELTNKIDQAREQIDVFRKKHDISSILREENELPATLIGLTKAFNDANEQLLKSKAKLDAVNQAIASGQEVVPDYDQTNLTNLEKEYRKLTAQMAEFDKHFTRDYLQYKGSMKYIPGRIKELEQIIKKTRKKGKGIVRTVASQDYYAAKQVVKKLRTQLDEHKVKAANFATLFSKHKKLMDDLESMELMAREKQDRLVKIQSTQYEKYPQVDVVERASINLQAISPDYKVGLYIVFISSLILAFFAVWLREFLVQQTASEQPESESLLPIATWFGAMQQNREVERQKHVQLIEQEKLNSLPPKPVFKKISERDMRLLLEHGDNNTQQLILLLLSGLNQDEISNLTAEQIDQEFSFIQLSGQSTRLIPIGHALQQILKNSVQDGMLWGSKDFLSIEELNAMLYCSAVDIGLDFLEEPLAEILRKTYIIFLVEQGLRLTALEKIVA